MGYAVHTPFSMPSFATTDMPAIAVLAPEAICAVLPGKIVRIQRGVFFQRLSMETRKIFDVFCTFANAMMFNFHRAAPTDLSAFASAALISILDKSVIVDLYIDADGGTLILG